MKIKEFLHGDDGAVAVEYIILVAGAGLLVAVVLLGLFPAMSALFAAWATYFGAGS